MPCIALPAQCMFVSGRRSGRFGKVSGNALCSKGEYRVDRKRFVETETIGTLVPLATSAYSEIRIVRSLDLGPAAAAAKCALKSLIKQAFSCQADEINAERFRVRTKPSSRASMTDQKWDSIGAMALLYWVQQPAVG